MSDDVVDAQIWCGSESIEGKRWDCVLPDGHAGPHTALIQWIDLTPEPEPVPEWRRLVDEQPDWIKQAHRDDPRALAWTLENLAQVALDVEVPRTLARTLAIAEAKVGDGWQADPGTGRASTPNLSTLLYWLAPFEADSDVDWVMVGAAASAWLRDLTEGGES